VKECKKIEVEVFKVIGGVDGLHNAVKEKG
jgi:hypothetical protein